MQTKAKNLPTSRPTVVWAKLPDGGVLFVPETEMYYGMNTVAASIWELLPQAENLDALHTLIAERYPDAALEQVQADVEDLFECLRQAGLVEGNDNKSAA